MSIDQLSLSEIIVIVVVILEMLIVFAALIALGVMRRRAIGREARYDKARNDISEAMPELTGDNPDAARARVKAAATRVGVDSGRRLLTELSEFMTLDHARELAGVFTELGYAAVSAGDASKRPWQRMRCIREARALGDPAQILAKLVKDELPDVRLSSFEALCSLGRAEEGMVSLAAICKDGRLARTRAIDALANADPLPLEPLIGAAHGETAELRLVAVGALGRAGATDAIEVVIDAVTDADVEVRIEALRALQALDDPVALPAALRAMKDEFWEVRSAAVATAASLGGDGASKDIARLLDDEAEWVRHNAALALTRCGPLGTASLREAAARGNENASSALAEHRLATEGA
ncbi:MAG: HEAT repeat domain-containing protein [Deltaproteobacteria bacterium]|nr:HEAT repeat domain-containing protein [Deltaproteobacteria bacterium]